MTEPLEVAIRVSASEARELLYLLERLRADPRLSREDRMTTYWLQNATERALRAAGDGP